MDLSKISTVVRPRSNWQAVDLGFRMAKQWYGPLVTGYITLTLPIFLLLSLLFYGENIFWAALLFWWCKPLWERILLAYLSVRQFGDKPDLKTQLKMWLSIASRQIIPTLLWRRLSPQRSYNMAIVQLENLSGERRAKRLMQFVGSNQQAAFWLTVVGAHAEAIIGISLYVLFYMLVPTELQDDIALMELLSQTSLVSNFAGYVAMVAVAPFYIAAGFSLYLNQRTQIEGWDIEIAFKRLASRHQPKSSPSALSALAALLLFGSLMLPQTGYAQQQQTETTDKTQLAQRQAVRSEARAILSQPPFRRTKTQSYPKFYLDYEPSEKEKDKPIDSTGMLPLIGFLANGIEWIVLALIVGLVIMLLIRYRHVIKALLPKKSASQDTPQSKVVFGLDITQDSIPDDPATQALELWQQGSKRQALSLLYRSALYWLIHQRHLEVHDSFTEGECLSQVKKNAQPEVYQLFAQITRHWLRLAYAAKAPDEQTMHTLCQQWPAVFGDTKAGHNG